MSALVPTPRPAKKDDPIRGILFGKFTPPEPSPEIERALAEIKAASVRRAVEIDLAIVGLDGRKIESVQRDWPGVDLASTLEDEETVARVDEWAENPVIENYARALQERRMAQKALAILDASIEAEGKATQASELLELLLKGRQVRDPENPMRRMQYLLGQAEIETPFGRRTVPVHGRDPGEAFVDVCRAMRVRDDGEIAAVLDCLRNPMSRVTLAGW
jgi:hypothetical protein